MNGLSSKATLPHYPCQNREVPSIITWTMSGLCRHLPCCTPEHEYLQALNLWSTEWCGERDRRWLAYPKMIPPLRVSQALRRSYGFRRWSALRLTHSKWRHRHSEACKGRIDRQTQYARYTLLQIYIFDTVEYISVYSFDTVTLNTVYMNLDVYTTTRMCHVFKSSTSHYKLESVSTIM